MPRFAASTEMTQSPELAGGAGFTFADQVAARYLAALLIGTGAPGLSDRRVSRVALEQRDAGEPLDDIVVDAVAPDGSLARLGLQVKRELIISAAKTNEDFRSIIRDSWATIDKPDFRHGVDRVGAAVGPSTAVGKWRDLEALAEFARASATPADFAMRFAPSGSASEAHRAILKDLQAVTSDLGRSAPVDNMHALLRHFVLIRFDALHAGATEDAVTITLLNQALAPGQEGQAVALFDRIKGLARQGAGLARSWERNDLRRDVAPWFKLAMDRALALDLDRLMVEIRLAVASISDKIGGAPVERPAIRARLPAMSEHQLVTLRGLPGSGKSVMLRREVEDALARGPALLLKADRLMGGSWAQFAAALGLVELDPAPVLSEIAVVGTPTLFIDGLDRIDKAQRGIVVDLLAAIERSPSLSGWRVLATLRDSGVEPVRTWLPRMFDGGRVTSISVDVLDDDEANALAEARPHLRPLLFGPEPVRTLVRRPFFAKILDGAEIQAGGTPRSEVELMGRWWARGGFDAEGGQARLRQRTLLKLVRLRSSQPDAPVALDELDDALLPLVEDLIVDGVLEDSGDQHFVRFAHDIFFEWSFAQLLIGAGARWVDQLRAAGEPPLIGRSVDLRAQAMFIADPDAWTKALTVLLDLGLRSQWRRVWLLAPLSHPEFTSRAESFNAAVTAEDHALLRSALVWFQAQHTVPNPGVLDGSVGDFPDRDVRLRAADLLGWPDDFRLWMRFLHFLHGRMATVPHRLLPHVLTLFEVWQNAMTGVANPISAMIVGHARSWLTQLGERHKQIDRFHRQKADDGPDPWDEVEKRGEFEGAVRRILLRAGRTEGEKVSAYLRSFTPERPAPSEAFDDIMVMAPLLSQTHPADLADLALNHFCRELPEDHRRRRLAEDRRSATYREKLRQRPQESLSWSEKMTLTSPNIGYGGPDRWDWDALALERDSHGYFPASPLHQPFQALFEDAPDEALRLVRSMTNHAVEAWRQLHRLQPRSGTPVPVEIDFPWGRQSFWGGAREFLWSRGLWAPKPLASAYLALDRWALDQVEAGADGDALIQRIVKDNHSIAALGIALHVALARPAVSPVNEALVITQRLWHADIERYVQEVSIRSSSQIGFLREVQRKDAMAVEALNSHAVRSKDIRALALLHVLQANPEGASRVRKAILEFAHSPDFELEEARNHPGARDEAYERARTFAAWGEVGHYQLIDVPNQPDRQAIVLVNPVAAEPAVRERLDERQVRLRTFGLFHWAERSFKANLIDDGMTLVEAVGTAQSLDNLALFDPGQDNDDVSMRRGAVAGVAAVVVALAPGDIATAWARGVLARAGASREEGGPFWTSVGVVNWHHVISVARAASADIRREPESRAHAANLLATLIHPLDCVGMETSSLLGSLWDVTPHVCWVGLGLALDLCILASEEVGVGSIHDPDAGREARWRKLEAALASLDQPPGPLPIPPDPWVHADASDHRRVGQPSDDRDRPHWRAADGWWRSDRAGAILAEQPLRGIFAAEFERPFVVFCERMLAWTIERQAPVWAARSRDIPRADIFEWTHRFAGVLGELTGLIDLRSAEVNFLDPICGVVHEETCFDLLAPFVTMFVCQHVLDAPAINPSTSTVLNRALDRLLASSTFRPTASRAGELRGSSMHELAQWLMFVGFGNASLAHRFSNGDWSEIASILPIVDRFVRTAGWAPTVMENFLTLSERAREHFPADAFADAILAALSGTSDPGARWRGTLIASRIALRVQEMADRAAPLYVGLGRKFLRILDTLVDQGDRRSAALQVGPTFRDLRAMDTHEQRSSAISLLR
ncbi:hypothetical protein ACQVP2_02365 [Methylobacterium aquaticum]|uniref:hypothetical protein n=1 Tax=Methylobacterium aquaticum TaxID=270351 RepID=UPI003D1724C6